jgi:hypothetical protein
MQAIAAITQSIAPWNIERADSSFMLLGWLKNTAPYTFQHHADLIVPEFLLPEPPTTSSCFGACWSSPGALRPRFYNPTE